MKAASVSKVLIEAAFCVIKNVIFRDDE